MERKRVAFKMAAVNLDEGTFQGHASVFNVPDDGDPPDIMLPGAFTKTIREWGPAGANRIKLLALHRNDWLPIGVPAQLIEDGTGLGVIGRVSKTTLGLDVLTLMRDGVLTELSIGFDIIKHEMDEALGMRRLKEVRLWEISPVTWAMHPLATIDAVKAMRTLTDRDLYALALPTPQPGSPTAPAAAAAFAFDPESLQSLKALTADIQSATATRRN